MIRNLTKILLSTDRIGGKIFSRQCQNARYRVAPYRVDLARIFGLKPFFMDVNDFNAGLF